MSLSSLETTHLFAFQAVAPKTGTAQEGAAPAPAGGAPAGAQGQPPSVMSSLLFPVLIMVPFVWMMFRRQKKEQTARAALKKGDRVATQAGMIGELVEMGDQVSKLKIAAGVTIEVLTSSVAPLPTAPVKKDEVKVDAKVATEKK